MAQLILIILGALEDIGLSGSKILPPSTSRVGSSPLGLAIAREIKLKMNEPNPNPPTITPLMTPLRFGKYSHPHTIGAI